MEEENLIPVQNKSPLRVWQRDIWIFIPGLVLGAALTLAFGWSKQPRAQAPLPQEAHLQQPPPGQRPSEPNLRPSGLGKAAESILTATGQVTGREPIEISARILGMVKSMPVSPGDVVTNGQVLVLLDDAEQQARLREAEGRLGNMRVQLAKAELNAKRMSQLVAAHIESQQLAEDSKLDLESARANFKEAEGAFEAARVYLAWTVIRSPINGVVLEKRVHAHEVVNPQSFGGNNSLRTVLLVLVDPADLQVEISLPEKELANISLNQPCRVSPQAYPKKFYRGFITGILPKGGAENINVQVKVQIRNPDRFLRPGLSARVVFLSHS